ncbi:MAG TPA: isochorismatase family protein [Oscillospiraceae bacterium]|nr:isochorismatase family protein [Oscillospiraceae bacterium]
MDKFTLIKEDTVLMIIDIQDRLAAAMEYGENIIDNTDILITISKDMDIPILTTEQYPKGLGSTVEKLNCNLDKDSIYEKISFTGCIEQVVSSLKQSGRKKVIVVGIEAHVCVLQTVRDLLADGYQVFVVADAVCSRTEQNYKIALDLMDAMGAVITSTETVCFDLLKEAGTPLFKKISKLIK